MTELPDPTSKAIEKTIEEAAKAAKEFLGKLISPGLEEGGGIISDTVKYWRFKNQVNITKKAEKFLRDKGIEPQRVLPKTLALIVENGSLEEDGAMQEKWAALLANAADPSFKSTVLPSYTEILKELSPNEAQLLDVFYDEVNKKAVQGKVFEYSFDSKLAAKLIKITGDNFQVLLHNLFRLNLCEPPASHGGMGVGTSDGKTIPFRLGTDAFFHLTPLGYDFVKCCRRI